MTAQIKKWIIKPLLITMLTLVVLTGITVIFLSLEHDRLVKLAADQINKQYRGELTIGTTEVSFFKHFPSIGFSIHDVKLYTDKSRTGEPVLSLDRLFVGVRPLGLVSKNHHVRLLSFNGGKMNLKRTADGGFNLLDAFTLLDTTRTSSDGKADMELDLQKILIKDVTLTYDDEITKRGVIAHIKELSSAFTSDQSIISITLAGEMGVHITSDAKATFFSDKKLILDINADYQVEKKLAELTKGNIQFEDAIFKIEGKADLTDGCDVDFKLNGNEPDFHLLVAFLPFDVQKLLKPFRYDGYVYFQGIVKGRLSHDELPLVEVNFGCKDGWFLNEGADKKVDQLGFRGYFTNGSKHSLKTSEIHFVDVNARPGQGTFKGNFVLRDFTHPHIVMQVLSELELSFLGAFFGITDLRQVAGKIKLEMDFKEIVDIELPEQSLGQLKEGIQSKLTVTDLSFHIPGYPHQVHNVNLHAVMSDGKVTLDSARMRIGNSDLWFSGTLSDIQGFIRDPHEPITITVNAHSNQLLMRELLSYDTALARSLDEEIHHFNVGMSLETSVEKLLHPAPLVNGKFEIKNLRGSFKNYAHTLKDLGANLMINDSILSVQNLTGMIDSSDVKFSGSVKNYGLWMKDIKTGRAEVAFTLQSDRFALRDIFTRKIRQMLPRGYRREELTNANLRVKINMRYDTTFRFMRAELSNVTCGLKRHKIQLKDVNGKIKYGANNLLAFDTLTGIIGKSDFDITMRLINTESKQLRSRTNYFHFRSKSLDVDEIAAYDFSTPLLRRRGTDSTAAAPVIPETPHAKAFNVFVLPFSDFKVWVDIEKFKYNKLWIRDLTARARLTEDHLIHLDTVGMRIAKGTVGIKGVLNGSDTAKILLTSAIKVNDLDLEKVMLKFDNFGQDLVINNHIKGRLSGDIKSDVQVHPNLVPLIQTWTARLHVQINDGTLVNFAPMQAMAQYFKDKNLRLVRFDSLTNELSFSNGTLNIPEMDINSSLGAIQISGKQSLDLSMEYYMRIPMKLVTKAGYSSLFGKQEQIDSTKIDEVIYAAKNKKGLFVHVKVAGTPSDFKVSLNKKGG